MQKNTARQPFQEADIGGVLVRTPQNSMNGALDLTFHHNEVKNDSHSFPLLAEPLEVQQEDQICLQDEYCGQERKCGLSKDSSSIHDDLPMSAEVDHQNTLECHLELEKELIESLTDGTHLEGG